MDTVTPKNKVTLLNLGCGYRYHPEWTNVDFIQTGENVIPHNLAEGIPFEDNSFDVVYHSHVLEHFSKEAAPKFINECFRVLKPGGTIRIAVPDLEQIAHEYIRNLEGALCGDRKAELNYDWIMIELYDQTVRETTGGAYGTYWWQEHIPNEDYMIKRMGYEYLNARKLYYLSKQQVVSNSHIEPKPISLTTVKKVSTPSFKRYFQLSLYKNKLRNILFKKELQHLTHQKQQLKTEMKLWYKRMQTEEEYLQLGRFRRSGEIHQWMYDRFSLKRLLELTGFINAQKLSAYESRITNWTYYELDTENGDVRKPDSLFMEATKPEI